MYNRYKSGFELSHPDSVQTYEDFCTFQSDFLRFFNTDFRENVAPYAQDTRTVTAAYRLMSISVDALDGPIPVELHEAVSAIYHLLRFSRLPVGGSGTLGDAVQPLVMLGSEVVEVEEQVHETKHGKDYIA